jgi:hypothetical protein
VFTNSCNTRSLDRAPQEGGRVPLRLVLPTRRSWRAARRLQVGGSVPMRGRQG